MRRKRAGRDWWWWEAQEDGWRVCVPALAVTTTDAASALDAWHQIGRCLKWAGSLFARETGNDPV